MISKRELERRLDEHDRIINRLRNKFRNRVDYNQDKIDQLESSAKRFSFALRDRIEAILEHLGLEYVVAKGPTAPRPKGKVRRIKK